MAKHRRPHKSWHLRVTWALSIVMLFLIFGFFVQSFQEMRKIAPVQVAVERLAEDPSSASEAPESPD